MLIQKIEPPKIDKQRLTLPQVGDIVYKPLHIMADPSGKVDNPPSRGRVIHVNPRHGHYTVEFLDLPGHLRQTYHGWERQR